MAVTARVNREQIEDMLCRERGVRVEQLSPSTMGDMMTKFITGRRGRFYKYVGVTRGERTIYNIPVYERTFLNDDEGVMFRLTGILESHE